MFLKFKIRNKNAKNWCFKCENLFMKLTPGDNEEWVPLFWEMFDVKN